MVARYDTETDNVASDIKNYIAYNLNPSIPVYEQAHRRYTEHLNYLQNVLGNYLSNKNISSIDTKIRNLYKYQSNGVSTYGAPWGSNYVAERLKADIHGEQYNIDGNTYKIFNSGLLTQLGGKKIYTEYVIEEGTEYIVKNHDDKFGKDKTQNSTTVKTTKMEIIFVEQST